MAKIANIVFYKFNGERENMIQTCIFYTDGTVKNVSYEDGLEACEAKMKELNVTSQDAFREMINRNVVHVISGQELEDNFRNYISTVDKLDSKSLRDIIDAAQKEIDPKKLVKTYTNNKPQRNVEETTTVVAPKQPVVIPAKVNETGKKEENSFQAPATKTGNVEDIFAGIDEEIEEARKNGAVNNEEKQKTKVTPVVIPTPAKKQLIENDSQVINVDAELGTPADTTKTGNVEDIFAGIDEEIEEARKNGAVNNEEKQKTKVTPVVIPTPAKKQPIENDSQVINVDAELGTQADTTSTSKEEKPKTKVAPVVIPTATAKGKNNQTTNNDVISSNEELDAEFLDSLVEETDTEEKPKTKVAPVVIPTPVKGKDTTTTTTSTPEEEVVIDSDIELDDEDFDISENSSRAAGDEEFDDIDEVYELDDLEANLADDEELAENNEEKVGFFARIGNAIKRGWQKVKDFGVKKLVAIGLALGLVSGAVYGCAAHQTKEGQMLRSNISTATDYNNATRGTDSITIRDNNDFYDNYSYAQLLEVTNNQIQKSAMTNLGNTITAFNGPFADAYVEEGKDIRAALSFDEVSALQQAYNKYSVQDNRAIFNGADVRSADMVRAYKDASLQLMGAYAIETPENSVDMSPLLTTEEGKEFYNRYHQLFLRAKTATGDEKLEAINAFYKAVREDFPISTEVRTEGIAHADNYGTIEPYKLSVTPMIAAAEMMFQNYSTDYTLNDSEIDFLNNLGLCNYAEETFERIETISLTNQEDNTNPLYEQYRDAIIYDLEKDGHYVIDDAHRELTKLDSFQKAVNWNSLGIPEGTWTYSGYTEETTETHTETHTWTETHTDYREEETREERPIPEEERQRIDQEIEEENNRAREEAERQAEEERQRLQQEADEEAERIRQEVEHDEQDLQERIEDANEQIRDNQDDDPKNDRPVNESDFGDHQVDFDDDHSDENGNLDDSVENITTDPTGYDPNEQLPDPNKTGRLFDEQASFSGNNEVEIVEEAAPTPKEEKVEVVTYEEPVHTESKSNQQLVDEYIASLEDSTDDYSEDYQYIK